VTSLATRAACWSTGWPRRSATGWSP
jgi:hypothetical protein